MSDIKFSCPQCQQHLHAEQAYAGGEISCPACNAKMWYPERLWRFHRRQPPSPAPPARVAGLVLHEARCFAPNAATTSGPASACHRGQLPANLQRLVLPARRTERIGFALPTLYLAMFVAGMAVLFFFARNNQAALLAYLGVSLLYVLTMHIVMLVCAFRASIGQGFLCLCIPFYALYFIFKQSESSLLMAFYGVAMLLNFSLYAFKDLN